MSSRPRPLPGGGCAVEVAPQRLAGWFERFADNHGGAQSTNLAPTRVEVRTQDGSWAAVGVPFPPLLGLQGPHDGLKVDSLVEHVTRKRRIGLVLVRRGGHSVGIACGGRVEQSSTDRHLVHGRNRAGGWSQRRFARRREGQARRAFESAADAAARVLLPQQEQLDAVVLGGDKQALDALRADPRLVTLLASAEPRVLDVPEPRRSVLDHAARRAFAVEIEIHEV